MKPLRSFSWLSLLLLASCAEDYFEVERVAPIVVQSSPEILPIENGVVELHISTPVINYRSMESCFRFAQSDSVTTALAKRSTKMQNAELGLPFIPIGVQLSSARDKLIVNISSRLNYNEKYTLFVFDCLRDDAGVPLAASEHRFVVEEAPLRVLSHDIILPGDSLALPGRKYFHFHFSHPIFGAEDLSVKFGDIASQVTISEDKRSLAVVLLGELAPGASYDVQITNLKDESGRKLSDEKLRFQTAGENFRERTPVFRHFSVIGYESHVDVDAKVLYLFRLRVRVGDQRVLGNGPVRIEGLAPNTRYDFEIEAENLFGDKENKTGVVETNSAAKVSINEVMARPHLPKGVSDAVGEYIEIFNYGSVPINIQDFTIEVDSKPCALRSKDSPLQVLPPKSYMILVGKKFDPSVYNLPETIGIFRMPAQTICGNLRNWPLPMIILRDESGRKIDVFSGMSEAKERGFSVERLNPGEKHGKEHYCYSRADVGPTPLRTNGVSEKGCE